MFDFDVISFQIILYGASALAIFTLAKNVEKLLGMIGLKTMTFGQASQELSRGMGKVMMAGTAAVGAAGAATRGGAKAFKDATQAGFTGKDRLFHTVAGGFDGLFSNDKTGIGSVIPNASDHTRVGKSINAKMAEAATRQGSEAARKVSKFDGQKFSNVGAIKNQDAINSAGKRILNNKASGYDATSNTAKASVMAGASAGFNNVSSAQEKFNKAFGSLGENQATKIDAKTMNDAFGTNFSTDSAKNPHGLDTKVLLGKDEQGNMFAVGFGNNGEIVTMGSKDNAVNTDLVNKFVDDSASHVAEKDRGDFIADYSVSTSDAYNASFSEKEHVRTNPDKIDDHLYEQKWKNNADYTGYSQDANDDNKQNDSDDEPFDFSFIGATNHPEEEPETTGSGKGNSKRR